MRTKAHKLIENELVILTKSTIDIFLQTPCPADLIALYIFYYYTAKWQGTNQPKSTTEYTANGLHWSEARVRKIKKMLIDIGVIEDVIVRDSGGRVDGHYIRVKYIFKSETEEFKIHTVDSPECGACDTVEKLETNALSDNNLNALSTGILNALSDNKQKTHSTRFKPPTLEEVQQYCLERNNNIDPQRFVDYYTSNGWMVGRAKMRDWKASVRTWEQNEKKVFNKYSPVNIENESPQSDGMDWDHLPGVTILT